MSKESYGTITLTDIEDTNLLGGHFIYNSDGAGVIQNIGDGPSNWGYNTWIGSNGIQLRDAATSYATLNANGLTLSKGGIKANIDDPNNNKVYLSSENYGSNLTINNHTTSDWREVIGSKFGVDAEGNLYASNAHISGIINALAGGTIGAFTLDSDYIQSTKDGYNMGIGNTTNWAFWAGWQSGTGAPFQVKQDGSLIATSANIRGEITATKLTITSGAQVSGVAVPSDVDNASYSVEIEVSSINFVDNNAILVAHPYFKGVKLTSSTTPTLSTITGYSWSRADGTAIPSGVTTNAKTLQLPNNSDLSATYVCTISN